MNRLLIAVAAASLIASSTVATAQEQQTRQYLPEQGDFAIGIDVMPLLKTIGNAFNKDESVPVGGSPFVYGDNNSMYLKPNVSIAAKYMLSDSWGLKLNLGLAVRNNRENHPFWRLADVRRRISSRPSAGAGCLRSGNTSRILDLNHQIFLRQRDHRIQPHTLRVLLKQYRR